MGEDGVMAEYLQFLLRIIHDNKVLRDKGLNCSFEWFHGNTCAYYKDRGVMQ